MRLSYICSSVCLVPCNQSIFITTPPVTDPCTRLNAMLGLRGCSAAAVLPSLKAFPASLLLHSRLVHNISQPRSLALSRVMATCRVPNRYVARSDLIALLDRLFPGQYIVTEHSDAWVVSNISRELTEKEIESISKRR
ncbi:hypothetical protein VTN96DRAFT_9815 [Rasamsonia emersonii]